jgi:phage shock protein PspC (stress-responsive transcriptional regulator)
MNCNDAMAALVKSLEDGTTLNEEVREHLRLCVRCQEMLGAAKAVLRPAPDVDPAMDAAVAAAEREVARKRFWRGVKILAAVGVVFAAFVAAMLVNRGELRVPEAVLFTVGGLIVAMLFAGPLLLLIWFVRGPKGRVYKRLGPGRMLSGVCLGLAEASKLDVRLLRVIFVVLLFFDGAGFWIYLLLDLAMPVHPDERQHLLRFRLRRWWRRMTNAEQRAG